MKPKETYLGDGLYASFDGWMIILRAPRSDGDDFVGLEPDVYAALLRFVDDLRSESIALGFRGQA